MVRSVRDPLVAVTSEVSRLRAHVRPVTVTAVAAAAPAAAVAREITGSDYEDDFEEYDSE